MFTTKGYSDSIEDILNQIDQVYYFSKLLGFNVRIGERFKNPFRADKRAGVYLKEHNGIVLMFDWAERRFFGINVFQLFRILNPALSYMQAIQRFREDSLDFVYPNIKGQHKNKNKDFQFSIIAIERQWNKIDKEYWSQYDIPRQFLDSEKIKPVKAYLTNSRISPLILTPFYPTAGYWIPTTDNRIKIYMPEIEGIQVKKFITNQTKNSIGGLSSLNDNPFVFFANSFKDYAVITLAGFNARFYLCETVLPELNKEFLESYIPIFIYDNDEAGRNNCSMNNNRFMSIVWPEDKDPAMFVKNNSIKDLSEILTHIINQNNDTEEYRNVLAKHDFPF